MTWQQKLSSDVCWNQSLSYGDCKTVKLLCSLELDSQSTGVKITFSFIFLLKRRDLNSIHCVKREVKDKKGQKHWGLRNGFQSLEVYLGSAVDLLCGLGQPGL